MTVWFTADPHFHHLNICRLAERPFSGTHEMNEILVRNWNECVRPEDTVFVLGDFVLGHKDETLAITRQLLGQKHLVVGNHDGPFDVRPAQRARWTRQYLEAGFTTVIHGPAGYLLLGQFPVLLSHFPYQADERHEDKYTEHNPYDGGLPIVHGHVHNAWTLRGRQLNVGVDVQNFRPVAEVDVWRAFHVAKQLPDRAFESVNTKASAGILHVRPRSKPDIPPSDGSGVTPPRG